MVGEEDEEDRGRLGSDLATRRGYYVEVKLMSDAMKALIVMEW